MPDYKKHILIGFGANIPVFLLFLHYNIYVNIFAAVLTIFIYSQLADIDTRASKIRWFLTTLCAGTVFISLVLLDNKSLAIIASGILVIIWVLGLIKGFQHRGYTHSLLFALLLSGVLFVESPYLALIAFVAYTSHIIADKMHIKPF